jgi:hypothetical protein
LRKYFSKSDPQILNTTATLATFSNLETMIKLLLDTPFIGPGELQLISERRVVMNKQTRAVAHS